LSLSELLEIQNKVQTIHIEQSVLQYSLKLVRATRKIPEISGGVSVRGGLQLLECAKALAYIRKREFVIPKEIQDLVVPVLAHRLHFTNGNTNYAKKRSLIMDLLDQQKAPR
jgi:MoxR-like ATPase